MSDVSTPSDSPGDSSSPQDQILAEFEVTRVTESDDDRENQASMEANEQDPTEDNPKKALPVESPESEPVVEVETELESKPDIQHQLQAQSESSSEPASKPQDEPKTQNHSQSEQREKEDGTLGQPYSVDDETAGGKTASAPSAAQLGAGAASANRGGPAQARDDKQVPAPDTVTDGRVKQNPVPHKYVAKTSKRDGNFGVMQMGHGRTFMDARDLAAKRSSEATQAAAEEAVRNGYNGMARRKHVWKPADSNMAAPPPPQQHQQYHHPQHPYPPQSAYYPPPMGQPPAGLSLPDVKSEQARLLTFLRSIHPVIVVDQLCKALAYFGGIPGAPPPQDQRAFPQSAKANGSGMLLVSWLSEIYPPADFTKPPFADFPHNLPNMGYAGPTSQTTAPNTHSTPVNQLKAPAPEKPVDPNAPVKRPRGRPKGSKNSKFRKDKGAKKLKPGDVPPHPDGTPWQPGDPNPTVDLTQDTNSSMPAQTPDRNTNQRAAPQPQTNTGNRDEQRVTGSAAVVTPEHKKRGRPQGSKTYARAVPAPNLPRLPDSGSATPGPAPSPSASVSKATGHISSTQYESPEKAAPFQQRTPLSHHAQAWANPSPSASREQHIDPTSEAPTQTAPPPAATAGTAESSQSNEPRKRKQQHSPLALPWPMAGTSLQTEMHQPARPGSSENTEAVQGKRRRIASGASQASIPSIANSQSQSPALSINTSGNTTSSASNLADSRAHGGPSRAPIAKPGSRQAPHQHQHQTPLQQGQHQSQSPSLNHAQNNMETRQQGQYDQKLQQRHYDPRQQPPQQQQFAQAAYQQGKNNSFGGSSGINNTGQFSYDNDDYMNPNPYAVSARRAIEDASSFENQSMYGQFGGR